MWTVEIASPPPPTRTSTTPTGIFRIIEWTINFLNIHLVFNFLLTKINKILIILLTKTLLSCLSKLFRLILLLKING